jgi:hypothetical protein
VDEAVLHGEDGGAGAGGHGCLVVDVDDVGVDRRRGDEQLGRDLALGAAADQQPQDLNLTAGEAGGEADAPGRPVAGGLQDGRDRLAVQARLGLKGVRAGRWGRSETSAW